ncbi:malonyl-CoA decarboxylase, mitochondrial isoform X1 [Octopus bimaculoides]|nr:malonyl-CoA decarboxylase, mitochondrial isoform X1 [Octopus bimaculoides]
MALVLGLRYVTKVCYFNPVIRLRVRSVWNMQATKSGRILLFLEDIFHLKEVGPLANSERKCKAFCTFYEKLMPQEKSVFLQILSRDYGINQELVMKTSRNFISSKTSELSLLKAGEMLRNALTPQYKQLFVNIGRIEGGVKFLVDLRGDVLHEMTVTGLNQDSPHLRILNYSLRELLSLWFSVGLLNLQRITWQSPCDMVQKISEYEAVHPIRNWTDLKRRVGSYRRCFVFIHNAMPREPVVVLHTALTDTIPSSIHSIIKSNIRRSTSVETVPLEDDPETELTDDISTAVFYSITSTQKGLQSVDLGNYLIKRVVRELQAEFPHMSVFTSLSPVPGFRDWLLKEITKKIQLMHLGEQMDMSLFAQEDIYNLRGYFDLNTMAGLEKLKKTLQTNSWYQEEQLNVLLKNPLMRLCAQYLYVEKRRGYALNPVANFHLGNGAVLWRLNWLADVSPRGLGQSCSMMVNYRYFLDESEKNSLNYLECQQIPASSQVTDLVADVKKDFSTDNAPV